MKTKNDKQHLDEHLITKLVRLIAKEDDFESVGAEMLRIIAKNFAADSCYIYRYIDLRSKDSILLFQWNNKPAAKVENTPPAGGGEFGIYCGKLLAYETICLSAAELDAQGCTHIRSRLVCGIWLGERLYGFIGIDYLNDEHEFLCSRISLVNNVSTLFTIAFKNTHQNEQLQDGASLARQIMDNLPIPILLVDLDYRMQAVNPTKKVGVYQPLSELRGCRCYDTICKFGAPPEFCAVKETLATKLPARKEFSFGEKRLISVAQPIFDRNGEMCYALSVDIDITETTRQKETLEEAIKEVEAANRIKNYFLATVSHELRTPLNAIIGFSELLQESALDAKTQKEYLHSINFAGTALLNLVNDLLDISSIEAGQIHINPSKIDLADLLSQLVKMLSLKARKKNISLELNTEGLENLLYLDDQRMRQIILNLIGNAIKFTNEGGISVDASFTPKDVKTGRLIIKVSDTGIGISPENQEKVFEPFVHDSLIRGKHIFEGSGLGLTISRRLLEKMGGTISLQSEAGKGSTFTIEMDADFDSSAQASLPAPAARQLEISLETKPLRVLLIDDVQINLKVLAAMLKHLNAESVLAESAEAALALLKEDSHYDLIMTDMWMPGCNGVELAKRIRGKLKISGIPIALITGDTELAPADKEAFDHILHKPITKDSVSKVLQEISQRG